MGNSLVFPSILVLEVNGVGTDKELANTAPLIGETLGFEDFKNEDAIQYVLKVLAARPELAKAKARMFVRAKNPFEPDLIDVAKNVQELEKKSLSFSWYRVSVAVAK